MQLLDIIQQVRNDGMLLKDPKTKFKEALDEFRQIIPFSGRYLCRFPQFLMKA